jgi:hypothetical protein
LRRRVERVVAAVGAVVDLGVRLGEAAQLGLERAPE